MFMALRMFHFSSSCARRSKSISFRRAIISHKLRRESRSNAHTRFVHTTPEDYRSADAAASSKEKKSRERKLETNRRIAAELYEKLLQEVVEMEVHMGIERRWEPQDPQYRDAMKYMDEREYHQAINHLHALVVRRLFELQELNLSRTSRLNLLMYHSI